MGCPTGHGRRCGGFPLRLVAIGLLLGLMPIGCREAAGTRPNVVLIVTDDQASTTLPYMPFVERELIQKGTSFQNFILNDPICCPSRVTILLGQYRHNHQLELGKPGGCAFRFVEDHDRERTIGALIQGAGYRTGMIGKYLNSYDRYLSRRVGKEGNPLLTGWDDYHVLARRYPRYFDFYLHENGELVLHDERPVVYQTDLLSRLAVDFIRGSTADKPFFLYIAPLASHAPSLPAPRHARTYKGLRAPRPPSFNQSDVSTQPSLRDTTPLEPRAEREVDLRFRMHVETLQAVDEMVRDIVSALEATGRMEDTFIFYTSDNGYHFGEHRILEGKATPFEESIRVPLIVRGPGVPAGASLGQLASNVDLHPTLLDIIGEPTDPDVDGRSLLPLLRNAEPPASWRRSLVIESVAHRRNQGVPPFVGLRTSRFKLVRYQGGERELYDLADDPHETKNVIAEAEGAIVSELTERLESLLECRGESCRQIEDQALPAAERGAP